MRENPEYVVYCNMKQRCLNSNHPGYENYGGRGIRVCKRWIKSFDNFMIDMGKRPSKDYSLERIDNNKGYSPKNCKWELKKNQQRNRRTQKNNLLGFKGITFEKQTNKFRVRISVDRKIIYLGRFNTIDEAIMARKKGEEKYWNGV